MNKTTCHNPADLSLVQLLLVPVPLQLGLIPVGALLHLHKQKLIKNKLGNQYADLAGEGEGEDPGGLVNRLLQGPVLGVLEGLLVVHHVGLGGRGVFTALVRAGERFLLVVNSSDVASQSLGSGK